ncbi:hypothetical protein [Herminiimonas aquatilis]|uniref:Uncharacterized protein n=1 Tax=Herminiimonas aquatilis TaxID=345342 RepID=A0ABW2J5T9_9BURK
MQIKKWEANETRFAQTAFTSLSIFCSAQMAASQRVKFNFKIQKQHQIQHQVQQQRRLMPGTGAFDVGGVVEVRSDVVSDLNRM